MKYFILLVPLWISLAFASPGDKAVECEFHLQNRTLPALLSDLARNSLDKETRIQVQIWGPFPAKDDFEALERKWKELGYVVHTQLISLTPEPDGMVRIDFQIRGLGREVAQALIEINNPETGLNFAEKGLNALVEKSRFRRLFPLLTDAPEGEAFRELMRKPVSLLEFSIRTSKFLRQHQITFIGDLIGGSSHEIGRKAASQVTTEINQVLAGRGLRLGMDVPGWPYDDLNPIDILIAKRDNGPIDIPVDVWIKHSNGETTVDRTLRRPVFFLTVNGRRQFAILYFPFAELSRPREIGRTLETLNADDVRDWHPRLNSMKKQPPVTITGAEGEVALLNYAAPFTTKIQKDRFLVLKMSD